MLEIFPLRGFKAGLICEARVLLVARGDLGVEAYPAAAASVEDALLVDAGMDAVPPMAGEREDAVHRAAAVA